MKHSPSVSHDLMMKKKLKDDPEFAVEYLKAALEDTEEPKVLLIALRRITEARGGFAKIARAAAWACWLADGRHGHAYAS